MGDCGCGKKAGGSNQTVAQIAIRALQAAGCTCPLVYSAARHAAVPFASRAQLSRCPYHGRAAGVVAAPPSPAPKG